MAGRCSSTKATLFRVCLHAPGVAAPLQSKDKSVAAPFHVKPEGVTAPWLRQLTRGCNSTMVALFRVFLHAPGVAAPMQSKVKSVAAPFHVKPEGLTAPWLHLHTRGCSSTMVAQLRVCLRALGVAAPRLAHKKDVTAPLQSFYAAPVSFHPVG